MYYWECDPSDPESPYVVKYDHRDGYARTYGRYPTEREAKLAINYAHGGPFREMEKAA